MRTPHVFRQPHSLDLSSSSPSSSLNLQPAKRYRSSPSPADEAREPGNRFIFLELFAGDAGGITDKVSKIVHTLPAQDLCTEGVDFSDDTAVQKWCSSLHDRLAPYDFVLFHVAPPCASFSRARDRSHRTRLRCNSFPAGWYPDDAVTTYGNTIARNTAFVVNFLLDNFQAAGSWEQPLGSYMFSYLHSVDALQHEPSGSVVLHQCRFGRPYRKPTEFACFGGLRLQSLDRRCTPARSCGRSWHQTLGFGNTPTGPAA